MSQFKFPKLEVYSSIRNMDQMVDYTVRQLGYPEVNVQLMPETVMQEIQNARLEYIRYAAGEGNYLEHFVINLPGGCSEISVRDIKDRDGNPVDMDIDYVMDWVSVKGLSGDLNEPGSMDNLVLYPMFGPGGSFGGAGGYNGGGNNARNGGMSVTGYEIAMNYLEDIDRSFGTHYAMQYIPGKEVIKIQPPTKEAVTGIMCAFNNLKVSELFNNVNFRKLCVAKTGLAWGKRLERLSMTMPGGGDLGGERLKSAYAEEYKEVMQDIKDESIRPYIVIA